MEFQKVSLPIFLINAEEKYYENIVLPTRATKGSAGYDFVTPVPVTLAPSESIVIPTGIRAKIDQNAVLMLFPRSGLGFSYHMRLANTVGVIDSDYYFADNEGHILVSIENGSLKALTLYPGERFCQGVFLPYFTVENDKTDAARTGGIGSTGSV